MALRDLAHQRQAQADATLALGVAGQAKKRLEDALAKFLRHASAPVADLDHHARRAGLDAEAEFAAAVTLRVLEQVAHGTAQQPFVAAHLQVLPAGRGAHVCGLFGCHRQQRHRLPQVQRHGAIQPAGQQHFLHQRIEFADVGVYLAAQRRVLRRRCVFNQCHCHLQPRQRRAQLMAGVGQQALVRAQQRFDAGGGLVETGAQGGNLVAAVLGHALVQGTATKGFDAPLERLQPPRQFSHHRVGPRRHGQEQHHQQRHQAHAIGPGTRPRPERRPRRSPVGRGRAHRSRAALHPPGPQGHPQQATVVETDRLQPSGLLGRVEFAAQEGLGRGDAPTLRVVQRHRQS